MASWSQLLNPIVRLHCVRHRTHMNRLRFDTASCASGYEMEKHTCDASDQDEEPLLTGVCKLFSLTNYFSFTFNDASSNGQDIGS